MCTRQGPSPRAAQHNYMYSLGFRLSSATDSVLGESVASCLHCLHSAATATHHFYLFSYLIKYLKAWPVIQNDLCSPRGELMTEC